MSHVSQQVAGRFTPRDGRAPASKRGLRTRNRIIEAALVVFEQRGLVEATMQEIGNQAGLSSGTVYKYFSDKADIFRFLLLQLREELQDVTFPVDDDGKLIVLPTALRFLELYRSHAAVYRVWWESLEPPSEFSEQWVEAHNGYREAFAAAFRHGQRLGVASPDLDVELAAEFAVLLLERPTFTRLVLGWDTETSDEQVARIIQAMLGSGLGEAVG